MIRETSLKAYHSITKELGDRQRAVYEFIESNPDVCNLEIAEGLHLPINSITPRVLELREKGFVESSGEKLSRTGRKAIKWKVVREVKQLDLFTAA